jgi:hypothetical protein
LQTGILLWFKGKISLPETYQPGAPIPKQQFEITQANTDSLSPFKKFMGDQNNSPLMIVNGVAQLPKDYYYHSDLSVWYVPKGCNPTPRLIQVNIVTDGQWSDLMGNSIKKPTDHFL